MVYEFYRAHYACEFDKKLVTEKFTNEESEFQIDGLNYLSHSQLDINTKLIITIALLNEAKNDREIAYIAAGPLEKIIGKDDAVDEELDKKIAINPKLRKAICGVWLAEKSYQGKVLRRILAKYNLIGSSL